MSLWTRLEEERKRQTTVQKAEGSMHSDRMISDMESDGVVAIQAL